MKNRSESKKDFCSVPGCEKPSRNLSGGYCEAHYIRLYRTGKILRDPVVLSPYKDNAGYIKFGSERLHRIVWRYHNGTADACCWGCGKALTWGRDFHIDHIDKDKSNNAIANLRASCIKCNTGREGVQSERVLTARGRSLNVTNWAREPDVFVTHHTIRRRLSNGMSAEDAIFSPKKTYKAQL